MLNRQYHKRVMKAALNLVGAGGESAATPADLVALVFGRHNYELDVTEAASYLDAARVTRGARLPERGTAPTARRDKAAALRPAKATAITVYTPADLFRFRREGEHLS
ncbi:hypothetical protein [Streptomyces sp. NPDC051662]|uniref:hypothetical protein n=1 Tax=Streptomyces sp. NPDC051662 TaxID=3154750 RepID=UPI00343476EE